MEAAVESEKRQDCAGRYFAAKKGRWGSEVVWSPVVCGDGGVISGQVRSRVIGPRTHWPPNLVHAGFKAQVRRWLLSFPVAGHPNGPPPLVPLQAARQGAWRDHQCRWRPALAGFLLQRRAASGGHRGPRIRTSPASTSSPAVEQASPTTMKVQHMKSARIRCLTPTASCYAVQAVATLCKQL